MLIADHIPVSFHHKLLTLVEVLNSCNPLAQFLSYLEEIHIKESIFFKIVHLGSVCTVQHTVDHGGLNGQCGFQDFCIGIYCEAVDG